MNTLQHQQESHKCSSCEYKIRGDQEFYHFRKCLNEHGKWAHRICKNCWWKIIIPFSEIVHLKCPGCLKKIPLWYHPKEKPKNLQKTVQVIQLEE